MRSFFQEKFQTKRFIKTKILWRLQLDLSSGHGFTVHVRVGQNFEKHAGQIEVYFFQDVPTLFQSQLPLLFK